MGKEQFLVEGNNFTERDSSFILELCILTIIHFMIPVDVANHAFHINFTLKSKVDLEH